MDDADESDMSDANVSEASNASLDSCYRNKYDNEDDRHSANERGSCSDSETDDSDGDPDFAPYVRASDSEQSDENSEAEPIDDDSEATEAVAPETRFPQFQGTEGYVYYLPGAGSSSTKPV